MTAEGSSAEVAEVRATIEQQRAALSRRDAPAATGCYAEHAELVVPQGTFVGRDAIGAYLAWVCRSFTEIRSEDSGIGVLVVGHVAVVEDLQTLVEPDGTRFESPEVHVLELDEDARITRETVYQDQWLSIRQGAGQRGGIGGVLIQGLTSRIDAAMEHGMPEPTRRPSATLG